jgi:hypothetical protein
MVTIRDETLRLIRSKRPAGFRFGWAVTRLDNGWWTVPIDDQAAMMIASERVQGECDDEVVSRLAADVSPSARCP